MDELKRILGDPVDRRRFLQRMGAAGLGAAALMLFDGSRNGLGLVQHASAKSTKGGGTGFSSADFPNIPGNNIVQVVLNYALTLELLESDLYRQAVNQAAGLPLTTPLYQDPFSYDIAVGTGGLSDEAAAEAFNYLVEFAYIEAAHRDFLITTLNGLNAPTVSANANGYAFPSGPGADLTAIISNLLPIEETGVRAYLGATPYLNTTSNGIGNGNSSGKGGGNNAKNLTSGSSIGNKPFLTTAATIYSTEARHSAVFNYLLGNMPDPSPRAGDQTVVPTPPAPNVFEYFQTPTQVLATAAAYFK